MGFAEYLKGTSERDGHVQLVSDSIESNTASPYGTWQRLAWIDDGQQIKDW